MLTLTDNASNAVSELATQAGVPEGGGLRIAASQAQEGSFELALVPSPEPQDAVVENGSARVFVDEQAATSLDNLTLDADPAAEGPAFVLAPQQ